MISFEGFPAIIGLLDKLGVIDTHVKYKALVNTFKAILSNQHYDKKHKT